MELHVFRCSTRKNRTGLTQDQTGSNLPVEACPSGKWNYWKTIDVKPGDPGRIGAPLTDEILDAISKDGYILSDADIRFEEKEQ